jgi:hypothetical protein
MTTTPRRVTIGVIVTLGLASAGPAASAGQDEPLTIALWVRDTAQVPDDVLAQAQAEVTQIYRQAGVEIVWLASVSPLDDTDADREPWFTVAILSRRQAERLHPALMRDGVGVALNGPTTRAHMAYVFYHRVERLTGGNGLHLAPLLGIAMAHEIGHLLLPYKVHSPTGLMRRNWTKADLRLAQRSGLFFTAAQSQLILRGLAGARLSPEPQR